MTDEVLQVIEIILAKLDFEIITVVRAKQVLRSLGINVSSVTREDLILDLNTIIENELEKRFKIKLEAFV